MSLFYLLISAMPFMQHPLFGAWAGGLTVTKYLGGLCLLYALYSVSRSGRMPNFVASPVTFCFFTFITLIILSFLLYNHSQVLAESPFALYFSLALQCFITPIIVNSAHRMRHVLIAQTASMALASAYMIKEWWVFHNLYSGFRPGAVVGDSNYFGVSVAATLPVSYFLLVRPGPKWQRLAVLGCIFLTVAAFLLGASRGGFLGLIIAALFLILRSPKPIRRLLNMAAIAIPLSFVIPGSPVQRLLHPTYSDEEAVTLRSYAWKAGIRMIRTHPIGGIGLGNFRSVITSFEDPGEYVVSIAHNTYIEFAAELGIPGFLSFLAILGATLWSLERVRRRFQHAGDVFLTETALGLEAGLIGSMVALAFVSGQVQKLFWFAIFLSMTLDIGIRSRPAKVGSTSTAKRIRVNAGFLARERAARGTPVESFGIAGGTLLQ